MTSKPKRLKVKKGAGPKHKLNVDKNMLEEVKILSGRGLTNEQLYCYYGVSGHCWYDTIQRHPELGEAFKEGKAKTIAMVAGELMKAIRNGNVSAIIFYLKTQARWSDPDIIKPTDAEISKTRYSITTTDPVEAARIYQQIMTGS